MSESTQKLFKVLGILPRQLLLTAYGVAVFSLIQLIAFVIISKKMQDPEPATMVKVVTIVFVGSLILAFIAYLSAIVIYLKKPQHRLRLAQAMMVVIILAIAAQTAQWLITSKKKPERNDPRVADPLVKAQRVASEDVQVSIFGDGTVRSKAIVKVVPQVTGLIIECHRNLVNGGFFKADETLITIDPRDYQFAVESAEATVASAQVMVEKELSEAQVARQEWEQLHPEENPTSSLVLRGPQVRQAQAQLKAANAQLERAKLDLERTRISVPFDGCILEESVDIGQYLSPGQMVATVYGTDAVEITVPLEDKELAWFDVPDSFADKSDSSVGSSAVITADFAGGKHSWAGRVIRIEGQIDPTSRMVKVVVEVVKPFERSNGRPPLMPGMFVQIEIKGRMLEDVIKVPRTALHERTQLWVANGSDLHIRKVEIARLDENFAYIASGIVDGEIVITDSLDAVTDGMKIRTQLAEEEN